MAGTAQDQAGLEPRLMPLPFAAWHALARIAELLPGAPITRNQVELMQVDTVASPDLPGFEAWNLAAFGRGNTPADVARSLVKPYLSIRETNEMAGFVSLSRCDPCAVPSEKADIMADPKHKAVRDDADREQRERRRRQEEALDDALKNNPASDPVSAEQPAPP
jgi:hypothetical protein